MSPLRIALWILFSSFAAGCGYVIPVVATLLTKSDSSSGLRILTDEDAELVVARGAADTGDSTEGKGVEFVAAQFQFTATKATTIRSITLQASGSGDDSQVTGLRIHNDLDSDGVLDAGDPQLGTTGGFSGDDGTATFADLLLAIETGKSISLLVLFSTPTSAKEGDTFRVEIASDASIVADTLSASGTLAVPVFGVPVLSGTKTVSTIGSLQVRLGSNSPPEKSAFAGDQNVVLTQLELRASSVEPIRVDQVLLRTSGTADESTDVTTVALYVDVDGDGLLNVASDRALATGLVPTANDQALTFNGFTETIAAGELVRWLVVYDLNSTATPGETLRVDLTQGSDLRSVGAASGQTITATGTPVGSQIKIVGGTANLNVTQPGLASSSLAAGQADAPILRLVFTETSGVTASQIEQLTVTGSGSGDEVSDVTRVSLWRDVDQDGNPGGGDSRLAVVSYVQNDGKVTFSGLSEAVSAGGTLHLLVTYDMAPTPTLATGETFQAAVNQATDIKIRETTTQIPVAATGLPLTGSLLTANVSLPSVTASQGTGAPAIGIKPLQADVPVLHLLLQETSGLAVDFEGVTLTARAESGEDNLDLVRVEFWQDANANGTFDGAGTETLLAVGSFLSDAGSLSLVFGSAVTIPASQTRGFFVTYDFADATQVLTGEQYRVEVLAGGVTMKAGGQSVVPSGLPETGNTFTANLPAVTVSQGSGASAGNPSPLQTGVPVLHLRFDETANEGAATLKRLALTGSGTGQDHLDLQQVRLWRDTNANNMLDVATDLFLGSATFATDGGKVAFALNETVPQNGRLTLFASYGFAGANQVVKGETYALGLAAVADVDLEAAVGSFSIVPAGVPQTGQTQTAIASAVALTEGTGAAGSTLNPDANNSPILHLIFTEGNNDGAVTLERLVLTATGTANDQTDLRAVKLWRDTNGNGSLDAAPTDTLIATGSYDANDGKAAFSLSETVPSNGALGLFVVYDLGNATLLTDNETLVSRVAASADVTLRGTTGYPITITGTFPEVGPTHTAALSPVITFTDLNPADIDVRPDEQNRLSLRFRLNNSSTTTAGTLDSLKITGAGTGNDGTDINLAELWRDVDTDGVITPGTDLRLAGVTYFSDPGTATFAGLSETIPASGSLELLVSYDMGNASVVNNPADETYEATVQAAADFGIKAPGGWGIVPTGTLPLVGAELKADPSNLPSVTVTQQVAIPPTTVADSETDVEMIQLRVTETTNNADVRITQLTVTASGSGDEFNHTAFVKLYRDQGTLGTLDGDPQIGLAKYFVNNGQVSFALAETITAGASVDLLLTYDMAAAVAAGATFRASVESGGGLSVVRVSDSSTVAVNGLTQAGPTHQKPASTIFLGPTLVSPAGFSNDVVRDLAAGFDLNGDGREDVVALRSSRFEVLEGNGAGGFGNVNASTAIAGPQRMAVGDMDRDGDLDVVVIRSDTIEVHPNDGSGGFGAAPSTVTVVGAAFVDLQLLDYDRDGDLDVVLLFTGGAGGLRGVKNDGAGALTDTDSLALTAPAATPRRLALADVDRDGFVDAVVTDSNGAVRLATGGATFFTFVAGPYPTGGAGAQDVVTADLNRNGRPDVVVVDEVAGPADSNLYTLQGASGPAALSAGVGPLDTSPGAANYKDARDLVLGDWTGDAKPDVAVVHAFVAAGTEGVSAHLGDGTLTLGSPQEINLLSAIDHDRIATGDLNGDGDPDLIVASSTVAQTGLTVILGEGATNGGGVGYAAPSTQAWGKTSEEVAVGDFDLDGDLDFAIAGTESVVGVFLNNGAGTAFTFSQDLATGARARHVEVADVNRDGKPDLVVVASGTNLLVFLNDGTGNFGPAASDTEATGASPRHVSLADLNQDGILDAVVSEHNDDKFQIYLGDGSGFAAPVGANRYDTESQPRESRIADYDGDGDLDILVLSHSGLAIEFFPNNIGTFTFGAPTKTDVHSSLQNGDHFEHGDLNGDGRLDLVVVSRHATLFEIFQGNGNGTFASLGRTTAGPYRDVLLVDTDKDGDLDLVFTRQDGANELVVHENQGGFTFGAAVARTMTGTPLGMAAGDFDRDGQTDIVAAVSSTQNAQVFLGN